MKDSDVTFCGLPIGEIERMIDQRLGINEDCKFCFEGHGEFDYDNCVLLDDNSGEWIMYIETGVWDDRLDRMGCIEEKVNFCAKCGRVLKQEEDDYEKEVY